MKEERLGSHTGTQTFFEATTLITLAFSEVRQQLERRFVLIDAILHIGFRKKGTYSARIFVPKLDDDNERIQRRRLCFVRTDIPQTRSFAGKEMLLLGSGKLIDTGNPDPFDPGKDAVEDESPQVYEEYGDYLVRLEAPTSTDEDPE
jgi:hypothetical protein